MPLIESSFRTPAAWTRPLENLFDLPLIAIPLEDFQMPIKEGDKILVTHRRLFEKDETRFFAGRVDAYDAGVVKVTGHSFVRDFLGGRVIEKIEERTKILSLSSGTLIVYLLPGAVACDTLTFVAREGLLELTDGKEFRMNLTEHPHQGQM